MLLRRVEVIVIILLTTVFVGCFGFDTKKERSHIVYVELSTTENDAVVAEAPPEKIDNTAKVSDRKVSTEQADQAAKKKKALFENMKKKGLLFIDVANGKARYGRILENLNSKDYAPAMRLMDLFLESINQVTIDEAFIAEKNNRLLQALQENPPTPEMQKQIDSESEAINQLLDQENYLQINKRMNVIFNLLGIS